jgi:hypothetical protein
LKPRFPPFVDTWEPPTKEKNMRKVLLSLAGVAMALTAVPSGAKTFVCTKWNDGVCVSMHRVKGTPPYATGYVFGPSSTYTSYSDLPQPVVSYYKLSPDEKYVYREGYVYVVDPSTGAVTRVIDTYSH